MKIRFACYQSVMLIRGGPHVKIIETKKYLEKLGVDVEYFNMWDTAENILDCDLVHLFSGNLAIYTLARNLKMRNVKFVVNPIFYTRHSAGVVRFVNRLDKLTRRTVRGVWWDWGFTRDTCQWAEAVLPNTIAEGELISQGLGIPQEKIEVIHNGVSEKFLHGDPSLFRKKYGMENFILNVGHIGPDRKNVLNLVKALRHINHPAVIIGRVTPGGEADEILKIAGKNKNLLIINGLDHNDPMLASAYTACDVFVLPSKFETPGRAALEAALAGAKIVITPYGGTTEYFGDMAEYVNPYSVSAIREGIEKALHHPKTEDLKRHIKNHFLWGKIAEKSLSLYKKVLNLD